MNCCNPDRTARGIDALKLYRSEYGETLRVLRPGPLHDWTSHAADAFRYLAMTIDGGRHGFNRRIVYPRIGVASLERAMAKIRDS